MARRYSRREFVTDAAFMLCSSLLLKALAPGALETEATWADSVTDSLTIAKGDVSVK